MRRLHLDMYSIRNYTKALILPCLVLLPLMTAHAQTQTDAVVSPTSVVRQTSFTDKDEDPMNVLRFDGAVKILTTDLTERGDNLLLRMELRVNREAISKRQSWAIVPQLTYYEGEKLTQVTLPYALINGHIREQLYKRKINYGNRELLANLPAVRTKINRNAKGDEVLLYSMQVPYEAWMDMAELNLHAVLISPTDKKQLLSVENIGKTKFSPRMPYKVQPRTNFIKPEPEQKQRKMQGQAYLDFQVGRSIIIPTFRRNPEELAKIEQAVTEVRNNLDVKITGLFVEGYASPEGSYASNDKLAYARSEALRDYMVKEYGFDRGLFRVSSVAEDWDGLRVLIQESAYTDEQRQAALAIIDSKDDYDRKETRLRAQSRLWQLVSIEMFPQLRRVEYQLDFSVKDYTIEESRSVVGRNPEMLSQRELFLLAMTYPEGSEEREKTFELIWKFFPDDTVATINAAALMLSRNEPAGAKRLLERVASDPRVNNNLGVCYLMIGELDKAKECLEKAVGQGVEEAVHNLEEVKKKTDDIKKIESFKK